MKGSGLEDLEQQMHVLRHRHLHELQKPKVNGDMQVEELMTGNGARLLSHAGGDRLEGEALISNRQQVFEELVASNRHSCLAEGASPWRAPKSVESTALEAFRERLELTERTDLVGPKLAREPLGNAIQQGMGRSTTSDLKLSGNSSRTCRICNKQFPSGRALGGHMRVHGPFFAPGSVSSRLSYGVIPATNTCTQGGSGTNGYDILEEDSGPPSIVDALDAEEMEEDSVPLQVTRSAHVASSGYYADRTVCLDRDNSYAGEIDAGPAADSEEERDSNITERRLVSLITDNSQIAHVNSEEAAKIEANTTARKSRLSKLRHNPKRSRWFAEQEFAFELASMGDGQGSFPVERRSVCFECGKAFPSERALFGHMRCHRDRDRRSVEGRSEQPADAMVRLRGKWRVLEADKRMESSDQMNGSKRAETMDMEELVNHREGAVLVGDKVQDGCFNSSGMMQDDDVVPARWPTAGRRSRRNVGASKVEPGMENRETSSSTPEDEPALTSETISLELGVEEQEIETPDFLIMLADAARKIEEETETLLSTEKYACLRAHVKRSKDYQMDDADYHPHEIDEHEDTSSGHDRLVVGSIGKYECTTCKKSFHTHQALGGHRASHKKTKGCFARTGSSDASEEHLLEDELELSHVQQENKGAVMTKRRKRQQMQQVAFKGHACSICHRIFLTGQALGGHKRCHWTGEKPFETASVASTNKQLSLQSEGKSMVDGGIDLNRPAPVDEDADEVGFAPTEMHSINDEGADRESEVEKRSNAGDSDLVLGTSALAWAVKDLLKEDTSSSPPPSLPQNAKKESEVRRRFDGIWGQHWPNNIGVTHTQLHRPVYAMQSLV